MGQPPRFKSYYEFFHECISQEEAQQIISDINLDFQPGSGGEHLIKNRKLVAPIDCDYTGETFELSAPLVVLKALQLLNWSFFDNFPVLNMRPYQWFKNARYLNTGNTFRIFKSNAMSRTLGFWSDICLGAYRGLSQLDYYSIPNVAALMIHEMRHSVPGGFKVHECISVAADRAIKAHNEIAVNFPGLARDDQSLEGGGACAVEYWFWVWVQKYFPDYVWDTPGLDWGERMRFNFQAEVQTIWETQFCSHYGSTRNAPGEPPTDPSKVLPRGAGQALYSDGRSIQSVLPFPVEVRSPGGFTPPQYGVPMLPFTPPASWYDPAFRVRMEQQLGLPWFIIQKTLTTI